MDRLLITLIQLLIFTVYVFYIYRKFGVLSSISASSYALKGNRRYLFAGWLIALAITTYWQGLGFWGHLMAVGFVTAGMTIEHKKSDALHDEFHTIGTIVAIASAFLGLYFLYGIWEPAVSFAVVGTGIAIYKENPIWWIEIAAMVMVAWGMLAI